MPDAPQVEFEMIKKEYGIQHSANVFRAGRSSQCVQCALHTISQIIAFFTHVIPKQRKIKLKTNVQTYYNIHIICDGLIVNVLIVDIHLLFVCSFYIIRLVSFSM